MIRWGPSVVAMCVAVALQPQVAADPVVHVLLQMPALAVSGAFLPLAGRSAPREWVGPLFILALTTAAFWMLPRSVDAALGDWASLALKYVSLPLGVGLPLALTWRRLGPVARGFIKAQTLSMLLFLAFLYTHAPVRICNLYLVDDQQRLGVGFAVAAIGLTFIWLTPIFFGSPSQGRKGPHHELHRIS